MQLQLRFAALAGLVAGLVFLPSAPAAPPACGGHGNRDSMIVTTGWLAGHLKDPNLVVLAIGQRADYDAGHIPGSQFLDFASLRAPVNDQQPLQLELPAMDTLVEVFSKLGVGNDSRTVIYTLKDQITAATRAYLTLDVMGLGDRAALLDGGLPVWHTEKRAVSTETPAVKPGKLQPCRQEDVVANLDYVKSHLRAAGVGIVDSRVPEFYTGAQAGRGKRAGHIPGASNIPFSTLVDEQGKLKPAATLAAQFSAAGLHSGDRVVSYCHIGQQATLVYFVARYLGFDARMYDGSWDEWSNHAELPAETAAAATRQ